MQLYKTRLIWSKNLRF